MLTHIGRIDKITLFSTVCLQWRYRWMCMQVIMSIILYLYCQATDGAVHFLSPSTLTKTRGKMIFVNQNPGIIPINICNHCSTLHCYKTLGVSAINHLALHVAWYTKEFPDTFCDHLWTFLWFVIYFGDLITNSEVSFSTNNHIKILHFYITIT